MFRSYKGLIIRQNWLWPFQYNWLLFLIWMKYLFFMNRFRDEEIRYVMSDSKKIFLDTLAYVSSRGAKALPQPVITMHYEVMWYHSATMSLFIHCYSDPVWEQSTSSTFAQEIACYLTSIRSTGIHLMTLSLENLKIPISKIGLQIAIETPHPDIPGSNGHQSIMAKDRVVNRANPWV